MRFNQKVIWITGASSGIGEALVMAFAREGATVILSARRVEELERVKKAAGLSDERALLLPFDLANLPDATQLVEQILKRFGRIDVLVNNGGISQRALAENTDLAIDRKIMEVNFFATITLTKAVLPVMLEQKDGHFVIISSIAGKFGFYLRTAYSASKHALHGYFESLRLETEKKGIRTLIVCPGKIKTNISLHALTEKGQAHNTMDQSHTAGMSAESCAEAILSGMRAGKEEILIGGKEIRAVWVKRYFPGLFGRIIRNQKPE